MNLYVDSKMSDDERRSKIYGGSIFLHPTSPSSLGLCQLAQDMIQEAFGMKNVLKVHESLPAAKCAEILASLKPAFIHHPRAKVYLKAMLAELGCDLESTYFDVPRLRTAFPGEYLSAGIAYAFHPHRDTWYSAPFCQINWWMPVFQINADNCMAIHPSYWGRPVRNGSAQYNYYRWNQESRHNAASHVKTDTRIQPRPEEPMELDPQIRLVCKVGAAYQFSAAHMHSTVPNTSGLTRYSIDFRTVHLNDVRLHIGASNVDSACTGTTMGDYLKGSDLSHIPKEAMSSYLDGTENQYEQSPATVQSR
jgi:hypothetical protein